jgi:hypothetical protein
MELVMPEIFLSDIFLVCGLTLMIFVIFLAVRHRRARDRNISREKIYFPKTHEPDFVPHMARALRETLSREYLPHKSSAHTANEIARYARSDSRVEILGELEKYEYQGRNMTHEEKEKIVRELMGVS